MKRALFCFLLLISLGGSAVSAQGHHGGLLNKLLAIAEPDQVEAFKQMDLTPQQIGQLQTVAAGMLPRVEEAKGYPGGVFMLVPEALGKVDGVLTPAQRPLARRLVPRAHQWSQLKELYEEYRR